MGLNNPKPVLHGRDHAVGATDPIPGLGDPTGYERTGVPIHDAYYLPGNLAGWWRLNEAGPWPTGPPGTPPMTTSNICVDSGPAPTHNFQAQNHDHTSAAIIVPAGDKRLPTMAVVPGALEGGDADDGGIGFHWNQYQWLNGNMLETDAMKCVGFPSTAIAEPGKAADAVGAGHTISAFLAFEPYDLSVDKFDPSTAQTTGYRQLISTLSRGSSNGFAGWFIGFDPAFGNVVWGSGMGSNAPSGGDFLLFTQRTVQGMPPPDATGKPQWFHFAKVFRKTSATTFQRTLYINLNPVSILSGDLNTVHPANAGSSQLTVGGGMDDDVRFSHGRGWVDELAIWTKALSTQELANVYNGRVLAAGDKWVTGEFDPTSDIPDGSIGAQKIAGYPSDPNQLLRGDGSWGAPLTGAIKIAEVSGASGTYPFTIPSSPAFTRLQIVIDARGDAAATNVVDVLLRLNGDTAANYSYLGTDWNGTAQTGVGPGPASSMIVGAIPAAAAVANHRGQVVIEIGNANGTNAGKQVTAQSYAYWAVGAGGSLVRTVGGVWMGAAAAITSLTLLPSAGSFGGASRAVLWGYT